MTAVQIAQAVERNEAKTAPVAAQATVPAVGGVTPSAMSMTDIQAVLDKVHGSSAKGVEDGTRVHIHYEAFGKATPEAVKCAARAADLGLPRDRYTGRVSRVWKSKDGDQCVTIWVELERDHLYRTLNLVRGKVHRFVILGN